MSEGLARTDVLPQPAQAQRVTPPPDIYQPAALGFLWQRRGDPSSDRAAQLGDHDILPCLPINHGPTVSMYYHGPDGARTERGEER
jgi:hypothetical protein